MVWKFVESQLQTFSNVHTMEVSKRLEVSWKVVGSRNDFHDLEEDTIYQWKGYATHSHDFVISHNAIFRIRSILIKEPDWLVSSSQCC